MTNPPVLELATATSSFQIEGSLAADGRGASIWDTFCARPEAISDGSDGTVACDSYHRWSEDLDLVAGLGADAYRFSISWPRVQPTGRGPVEPRGLDYYERIVDGLLARGLDAHLTLYHWDLPQALEDAGGWPARDTALRFAEYAALVAERLGDRVTLWATMNEPWVSAFVGYAAGRHAPGRQDAEAAFRAAHHLLLGHALGAEAVRGAVPDADVGIVLDQVSVRVDDEAARPAAERIDAQKHWLWLEPLRDARYPELVLETGPVLADPGLVQDGDLARIQGSAAWIGVNYYFPMCVIGGEGEEDPTGHTPSAFPHVGPFTATPRPPLTTMGWEVDPQGLSDVLDRLHAWDPAMPLRITENGAAYPDNVRGCDGSIDDQDRIDYLRLHLAVVDKAVERGVDLRTYTVWSLLDNFEWGFGYAQKFGIVEVDPVTRDRRPKASYRWLADEIRRRRG